MLVSLDRLQAIRTGQLSLYKAFSEPESSFLYEVRYIHTNSEWHTQQITAAELDKDCLPLEDTFLNCDPRTLTRPKRLKTISLSSTDANFSIAH